MDAQHTPGPWSHRRDGRPELRNECEIIEGADGTLIVYMKMWRPEDAAHIVRCVNAHDDLLAALVRLVGVCNAMDLENESERPSEEDYQLALRAADAAIARATGSTT